MPLFINGEFPDDNHVKRLKLLLSTFTDGSGENGDGDIPGGFNFERVSAEWLEGIHIPGTKHIYDVVVKENGRTYGYSCKMLGYTKPQFDALSREGSCLIEVSNASAEFARIGAKTGLDSTDLGKLSPTDLKMVGEAIISHIFSWHHNAKTKDDTNYEQISILLHLAWANKTKGSKNIQALPTRFRLMAFDKHIASPNELKQVTWIARNATLVGTIVDKYTKAVRPLVEIYSSSTGGHVKYYPYAEDAIWKSDEPFDLLQAPRQRLILSAKAHGYWPAEWKASGGVLPGDTVTEEVSEAAQE